MFDFDSILDTMKKATTAVGQKTEELYEVSKVKMRVVSLRSQLTKEYKKLGRAAFLSRTTDQSYEIYMNGRVDAIQALIAEIDELQQSIAAPVSDDVSVEQTTEDEDEIARIRAEIASIKDEIENLNEE